MEAESYISGVCPPLTLGVAILLTVAPAVLQMPADGLLTMCIFDGSTAGSSVHCTAAGEAEAIYRRADATAKGIGLVSQAVTAHGGSEAASLRVAEQYLSAFGQIAKAGNTLLLPAATNDPANMVAQAMSIYKAVSERHPSTGSRSIP